MGPRPSVVTDITCEKKDMLLVNYEAPNGTKRHKSFIIMASWWTKCWLKMWDVNMENIVK